MLTHTIHMPPALSEIYGGPRPEWLRDIFEYLPHLQSLIVSQLPFFDHNSMVALRGAGSSSLSSRTYNIRLLIAQREPNTTSLGLAETLLRFPGLIYLDLSYTTSAKDQTVLSTLSQLEHLQVLKLRGIGLKDIDAAYLANAIGHRVRLLDLRGNKLTDMALQSLLQACFLPPGHAAYTRASQNRGLSVSSSTNPLSQDIPRSKLLRSPVVDEKFRKALTSPLTGRSWVEDLPSAGITHLYLADNQFTVDGVASLLTTGRLHVLDVGTVDTEKHLNESLISAEQRVYPGSEKLIPILGTVAKDNLTYLRAHHPICTSIAPHGRSPPAEDLLPELSAGDGTAGFNELDSSTAEIHELPADTTPVFELSGSSPRPKSPITPRDDVVASFREFQEDPGLQIDERRCSAIAPEVLYGPNETDGTTSPSVGFSALSSSPIPLCNSPISMEDSRGRKIQELLAKRPKSQPRRNGRQSYVDYLHPFQVPHLEVLVLTDVPSHVPADSPILESLMQFIIACSNEALLATLQAGSDYSLPPGQDRAKAEQERARSLFGLRQLVLEITPITKSLNNFNSSTWKSVSAQIGNQKSTTGDWDLERLWSAASDDFSFFGEPECGVPSYGQGRYSPMPPLNENGTLTPDELGSSRNGMSDLTGAFSGKLSLQEGKNQPGLRTSSPSFTPAPAPIVDLASELAAFRRRKKSEYEQTIRQASQRRNTVEALSPQSYHSAGSARGLSPSPSARASSPVLGSRLSIAHHVEGHWKGEIKIVRNATPKGRSGMVDMYGNYFEKGYLYP